jgi:hypothetical protein
VGDEVEQEAGAAGVGVHVVEGLVHRLAHAHGGGKMHHGLRVLEGGAQRGTVGDVAAEEAHGARSDVAGDVPGLAGRPVHLRIEVV